MGRGCSNKTSRLNRGLTFGTAFDRIVDKGNDTAREEEAKMALITMTHTIGSEAMTIARIVADGLRVEVYDDARLKEEALRMGLAHRTAQGFGEKPPDWLEHLWSGKPEMYHKLMESVIYEAARLGQGVIIGHGSQMLLHDFGCAVHVLVTAQEESRIQRLVHESALSREAARKLIRRIDNQKRGFFRYAFQRTGTTPRSTMCASTPTRWVRNGQRSSSWMRPGHRG